MQTDENSDYNSMSTSYRDNNQSDNEDDDMTAMTAQT